MKKKALKFVLSLLLVLGLVFYTTNIVYAASGKELTQIFDGTMIQGGVDVSSGERIAQDIIGMILSAVRIVAVSLSLIILTWLGIKYMSAAPSEKANIKGQLITFAIGAIVVVASTSILELVRKFAQSIGK